MKNQQPVTYVSISACSSLPSVIVSSPRECVLGWLSNDTHLDFLLNIFHDMVILNFNLKLRMVSKHSHIRKRSNVDRLKDLITCKAVQITVSGKFATLLDKNCNLEMMTNELSSILTEVTEVLGIQQCKISHGLLRRYYSYVTNDEHWNRSKTR